LGNSIGAISINKLIKSVRSKEWIKLEDLKL
jgi:hypothetical protein